MTRSMCRCNGSTTHLVVYDNLQTTFLHHEHVVPFLSLRHIAGSNVIETPNEYSGAINHQITAASRPETHIATAPIGFAVCKRFCCLQMVKRMAACSLLLPLGAGTLVVALIWRTGRKQ